jgi:hypothetical protein
MLRRVLFCLAAMAMFASVAAAFQAADMSGAWTLNVARSSWGKAQKPVEVVVYIAHKEPAFSYKGSIAYANDDTRDFAFVGSVDGNPYAMTRSAGPGTVTLRRIGNSVIESIFISEDGHFRESCRTAISGDHRTLTRRIRAIGPSSDIRWTEVYEKR